MSEHANLSGWLSQDRCPGCGYSLAGHAAPEVCPECAMSFAGVPGGAAWWARERFRLMSISAGVVAVATLATAAARMSNSASGMRGSDALQLGMLKTMAGGAFFTDLAFFSWCLAGLLVAMAFPKPRTFSVVAAAVACVAHPIAVLFERAVYDDFMIGQMALRWGGGGGGTVDPTVVVVRMIAAAFAPLTAGLLVVAVCEQLRAVGLGEIAQRFGWCGRVGMTVLPAVILLVEGIQLYFGAGPGGGTTLLPGGSTGGGGLGTMFSLLGPVQSVLGGLLMLVLAYCSARLWLRSRWMLETHPAA